jgi:hypothetical protein
MRQITRRNVVVALISFTLRASAGGNDLPFRIQVLDDQTGRGVPLVELKAVNSATWWTDSAGLVAFNEPGLMGHEVYFHVRSHGYQLPKDGFGNRGIVLKPGRGTSATIKLSRINIAERLYRITGEGIYRDSVILGESAPIKKPLLNGQVLGQDGTHAVPYRGRIVWLWGDTQRVSYPLGNFRVSGATSEWPLPHGNGLDPNLGVDLTYFVNESGFSRPMIPQEAIPGRGAVWHSGVTTLRDEHDVERLIASFTRLERLGKPLERGYIIYNDATDRFDRLAQLDINADMYLEGHPFRVRAADQDYLYSGYTIPCATRVRAELKHVVNPADYEGFTCLVAGTRYDKSTTKLDRRDDGSLNYGWKRATPPLSHDQQEALVRAGAMQPDEVWPQLTDMMTNASIRPHASTIRWNGYRQRWIMILEQAGGESSFIGEIWFAEADTPVGPWAYARKVVTHDKQSFYNPNHFSFFDQNGGRVIFFDGTYTADFSGTTERTPRYDYNLIMYRLVLEDPRLSLPAPVYQVTLPDGGIRYIQREAVVADGLWDQVEKVAFFAVPIAQRRPGLVPVEARQERGAIQLRVVSFSESSGDFQPVFYALPTDKPVDQPQSEDDSSAILPLYEYERPDGQRIYSTNAELGKGQLRRTEAPVCRVWRNPFATLILDSSAEHDP